MSGPKYIELKRTMTRKEFQELLKKIEKVAQHNNYNIVKSRKMDEKTISVDAKHWRSGKKIELISNLDNPVVDVNIEDEEKCQDILKEIADIIGDDLVSGTGVKKEKTSGNKIGPQKDYEEKKSVSKTMTRNI